MRIYSTSTGANDNSQPRRYIQYTLQPVDNDGKVVGKESEKIHRTFTNSKNYPKPPHGGTIDDYSVVGGYLPADEGDSTGEHPNFVQNWKWKNKYNDTAIADNCPYAQDGYPKGKKRNYHTVNGVNRYEKK